MFHFFFRYVDLATALNYPDGVAYLVVLYEMTIQDNPSFDQITKILKILKKEKIGSSKNSTLNISSFLPDNTVDFVRFKTAGNLK